MEKCRAEPCGEGGVKPFAPSIPAGPEQCAEKRERLGVSSPAVAACLAREMRIVDGHRRGVGEIPATLLRKAERQEAVFALGGIQMQITCLSREMLLEAEKDLANHKNIIVRVGGYSEYYHRLDGELRAKIIARTFN